MYKDTNLDDYQVFRRRTIELHKAGKSQKFIIEALGVSQSSVSRWIGAFKEKGEAFFERPKVGGSKRFIDPDQQKRLTELLDLGAEANGFKGNLWTRARVQEVIKREFGVEYKIRSLSDLLRDLGYTFQKPDRRSYRQDPEKVKEWQEETLPALKKSPK